MTSWKKIKCIVIISTVMSTLSWSKPALTNTMHALDDSELRKVTDHDHSSSKTHHDPNNNVASQNPTKEK